MKKNRNYLFFITPGFIIYTIFAIIPIIYVVYLAFTNYTGMGSAGFVGFDNFIRIFNDERFTPAFFNSLKNNLKYLLCVWFIITPFQYFLAYFFFIKIPAYKYIKFMVFLPYVISSTIIGFFATLLFNPNIGLMNTILKSLGMSQNAWFGNPDIAFKLLVLIILWQGAGSGIMIFYANFMDIPQEVMEACRVDGCTEWQRFTKILFPLSLPSCASIIMMSTIWALGIFDPALHSGRQKRRSWRHFGFCQHGILPLYLWKRPGCQNKSWLWLCHQCCNVFIYAGSDLPAEQSIK